MQFNAFYVFEVEIIGRKITASVARTYQQYIRVKIEHVKEQPFIFINATFFMFFSRNRVIVGLLVKPAADILNSRIMFG